MTLLAEDLLLLLLDDETGALAASTYVPTALGGALLAELALEGRAEVGEKTSIWSQAKVRALAGPPDDPVLARAHEQVAEKERAAWDLVNRLGKGVKEVLLDRLAERGVLERAEDKVLGLFPRTRWPATDSAHEDDVRRELTAVLVAGETPEPRTATLVSLLSAIDHAHEVVDPGEAGARAVRRRAKEIAEGEWAAAGVADAVAATNAAVTAAITSATVASTTATS